jgi:hypothetical protein
MYVLIAAAGVVLIGLNGCASQPPPRFAHATSNQQAYMQDRYVCLQEAQQRLSGSYVNQYGGSSQSRVVTNRGVFFGCMAAKGVQGGS